MDQDCRRCQMCLCFSGFCAPIKNRLDASTTFARRLRDVIYRAGGVEPSREELELMLCDASFQASAQAPQAIPPNKIACRSV